MTGKKDIFGALAAFILLPVILFLVGFSFLLTLLLSFVIFGIAMALFYFIKIRWWMARDKGVIEGKAIVIEERVVKHDAHDGHP